MHATLGRYCVHYSTIAGLQHSWDNTERLNQWLTEKRDLYEDYKHQSGEHDGPQKIVLVWLIAKDIFQRLDRDITFEEISIADRGDSVLTVPQEDSVDDASTQDIRAPVFEL